jgi:DNA polymerase III alpha subunit
MRLGLLYVKGLREESGRAIVRERIARPFASIDDLKRRVPQLSKEELRKLAQVGALNFIGGKQYAAGSRQYAVDSRQYAEQGSEVRVQGSGSESRQSAIRNPQSAIPRLSTQPPISPSPHPPASPRPRVPRSQSRHRRDALWQVERAARRAGPLLEGQPEQNASSPLEQMTVEERVVADFRGTGVTTGPHPMAYRRQELRAMGVLRAIDLREVRNGRWVKVAGWVIARQRPGTAKGFLFLSMEDETGIANVIVTPDVFDKNRMPLVNQPFLLIEGPLQNQDNVIHVRARRIRTLTFIGKMPRSRDFH